MDKVFLSIIIANYNYGHLLSFAIESILSQDDKDYEIIIIDGGSIYNIVDIIKKYQKYIKKWVSEPDKGQSNAFNKGFSYANGEFLTWLNADDLLLPGTIKAVKTTVNEHPGVDYVTGNLVRFIDGTNIISEASWGPQYLPKWLQGNGKANPIYGPTTFWRHSVYDSVGPIDESLHYTMDTDYWSRLVMAGCIQARINHYCWAFRMHNASKTAEFGDHERNQHVKEIMADEMNYIAKKTGYIVEKKWLLIGYIMRFFDGTVIRMLYNRLFVRGKNIVKLFNLSYLIQ